MTLTADTPPVLRLRPIPVREPGAALAMLRPALDEPPAGQVPLPFEPAPPPSQPPPGPAPVPGGTAVDPRDWALRFSQVALEVATGLRPAAQLVRWTTPAVIAALGR